MIIEDYDLELQAGSDLTYRFNIDAEIDLADVSVARFVIVPDYGKVPLLNLTSQDATGARVVVLGGSSRVDVILPGAQTKNLVTRGAETAARWQCELHFQDGAEIVIGKGPITIARDAQP